MLSLITSLSIAITIVVSKQPFTTTIFNQFKQDVLLLVTCDDGEDPNCPGLTFSHPDVSIYDTLSGTNADKMLIPGMIRLAFHDCAEIDPQLVAKGQFNKFQNGRKNGFAGGCNGCLDLNDPDNNNLLDGSILPFEQLCSDYYEYISRADCWALAATIASEHSASLLAVNQGFPFFQLIEPAVEEGDIPYFYGREDCVTDSEIYPFQNPSGSSFSLPMKTLGWSHMADFFKSRFGWNRHQCDSSDESDRCEEYFNNRDIIALITGGHSVGRGHEQISGFSGQWDFSEDTLDNNWISTMFNEDYLSANFGAGIPIPGSCQNFSNPPFFQCEFFKANQNWNQTTINIGIPQFGVLQNDDILAQFPASQALELKYMMAALNTDMSMLFDLSWYIENERELDIDCNSDAASICPEASTIITARRSQNPDFTLFNIGKTGAELGEIYECPVGDNNCCDKIQCPIQCEGGYAEFFRLVNNDLIDTLPDDSKCPAAIAKKYSNKNSSDSVFANRAMGLDYAKAFTKMITIGYYNRRTDRYDLRVVGDEDNAMNVMEIGYGSVAMYTLIVVIAMGILLCICVCGYCWFQKQRTEIEMVMKDIVPKKTPDLIHMPSTTDGRSIDMTHDTNTPAELQQDITPIEV